MPGEATKTQREKQPEAHQSPAIEESTPPTVRIEPAFHPFDHLRDSSGLSNEQVSEQETRGHLAKQERSPREKEPSEPRLQDFGESHDPAFGEGNRGAGGKVDSTQRDLGQTGQTM